jgi:hypothetical protein
MGKTIREPVKKHFFNNLIVRGWRYKGLLDGEGI